MHVCCTFVIKGLSRPLARISFNLGALLLLGLSACSPEMIGHKKIEAQSNLDTLAVTNSTTITIRTGIPPYSFALIAGEGDLNTSTGFYKAPPVVGSGRAVIRAGDSLGNSTDVSITIKPPIDIIPVTKTLAVNNEFTFQANGAVPPYTFMVVVGDGTIDSKTGRYTAPPSSGSAVIRVLDTLGNGVDASVTINPALDISPVTKALAVTNSFKFTSSGGVEPFTYSVVAGSGSIDSAGLFVAPGTPESSTVRITDSLGNFSEAVLTINPALTIGPAAKTLAVNNTFTFPATGGVRPYTFSRVSGNGSISDAGLYTAPGANGTDVIRVTDSLGNISDSTLTINPALSISPAATTLAINNTFDFSLTGGVPPYSYSVIFGGGSVNDSGHFIAPAAPGSSVVRATDSLGNISDSTLTINPGLEIVPLSKTLAVTNAYDFSSTGGVGPFTFSLVSGTGSVNAAGHYIAPVSAGSAVVRVTDRLGNTSDASITVNPAIGIIPTEKTLAVNNSFDFSASGGVPPYTYSRPFGNGSISAAGHYTAPAATGTDVVRVTDSLNNFSDSTVTINPALAISPSTYALKISQTNVFTASGGVTPYSYSVISVSGGLGSVDSVNGTFIAAGQAGVNKVRVTDAVGNTSDATVIINLDFSLAAPDLAVGNNGTFTGTGGIGPYTYGVVSGGGSIDPSTGVFTAPATPGTTVIQVTDSAGNTGAFTVTTHPALAISPTTYSMAVNNTKSFSASGGVAPYVYSVVSGGGSFAGATYTPAGAGAVVVRVTDSLGNTSDASVTVNAALAINPASYTMAVNNTKLFSASGGVVPYVYSVVSGGGSFAGATYTPAGAGAVVVRVTDSLGNTSDAFVTVNAALAISPASYTMAINNTKAFSASGGVVPYVYSVVSGGGSFAGATYTPAGAGAVVVRVTDSLGNTSDASVTVNATLAISPASTTLAVGNGFTFSATGGSGSNTYSVIAGSAPAGAINSSNGAYSAPGSTGTNTVRVTDSLGNTSDSAVTINGALLISPASVTVSPNSTTSFSASGGVGPYTYSVLSGGGSFAGNNYTAPGVNDIATVRVTDSIGNVSDGAVSTNGWTSIPAGSAGEPGARFNHSAVWTGSKMIVWGGYSGSSLGDGGIFDPVTGLWTATPAGSAGEPAARFYHTAVWTGSKMIVWGGSNGSAFGDGGMFDPSTGLWTAIPAGSAGEPAARYLHDAVWTGTKMIVWGSASYGDGGMFDPSTGLWTAIPAGSAGEPTAGYLNTAIWTGTTMIVWGGLIGSAQGNGAIFDPSTGLWTAIPAGSAGEPSARYQHTAVWTGSRMIIWGGSNGTPLGDGGSFNPATGLWTSIPAGSAGEPSARYYQSAVWTGSQMVIWGGSNGSAFGDGGMFDPSTGLWTAIAAADAGEPAPRSRHTVIWTGSKMIVWGGTGVATPGDGGIFIP